MTDRPARPPKPRKPPQVHTLLVQLGRKPGDGLPDWATGAGMLVYAAGQDEAEAVRETVALLTTAGMNPLEVIGHGTLEERLADGETVPDEERALMDRALAENAVVVAQVTPFDD